jgi:hypothetical protein
MPNSKNGAKSAEKIPALIVFGRIHGSNVDQAAIFLKKDAETAKKAALDAGLSSLKVQTEEHRKVAATLPEGVINTRGRFSLSPTSPEIMAELERLLKAATGQEGASDSDAKSETASPTISADLCANSNQVRWFSQRALIRTTIWTAGGKRSLSASTTVNSSSAGKATPTSPEPAAARNILPSFTRSSLAFDSSEHPKGRREPPLSNYRWP